MRPKNRPPREEPKLGPYYWYPTLTAEGTSWTVVAAHDFGLDPDTGHIELWPRILTRLAADQGKDATALKRRLGLSYTGLPRGRITKPDASFLVLHGDDAPVEEWESLVFASFALSGAKVKLLFDEHETQISGHPTAFSTVFDRFTASKFR